MNALLDFIYTGSIRVTQDNVQDLLIGSDMIQVQEVVDLCTRFLLDQLDPTNAIGQALFFNTFLCIFGLLPRASTMSPTITVIHGSARRFSQSLEVVSF